MIIVKERCLCLLRQRDTFALMRPSAQAQGKQGVGCPLATLVSKQSLPEAHSVATGPVCFLISPSLLASSFSTLLVSTFLPLKSLGIPKQLQLGSVGTSPAGSHGRQCASAQMLLCWWPHSSSHQEREASFSRTCLPVLTCLLVCLQPLWTQGNRSTPELYPQP